MKNILILFISIFYIHTTSFAQNGYGSFIDGSPTNLIKNTDVEGSEFLSENWSLGVVKTSKNVFYKDLNLKYNLLEDKLFFLGKDEQSMIFTTPIVEFKLLANENNKPDRLFRNGYPAISNFNESNYYEVLAEGKAILLKKVLKKISDNRTYNAALSKKITDFTDYYICNEGKMSLVTREKTFIQSTFPEKKDELATFITANKLATKKEEDLKKIVNYYNSL